VRGGCAGLVRDGVRDGIEQAVHPVERFVSRHVGGQSIDFLVGFGERRRPKVDGGANAFAQATHHAGGVLGFNLGHDGVISSRRHDMSISLAVSCRSGKQRRHRWVHGPSERRFAVEGWRGEAQAQRATLRRRVVGVGRGVADCETHENSTKP
jgi:hypothetical protein